MTRWRVVPTLRVSGEISTAMVCFAPRVADVIAVSPTPHPTSNTILSAIRWRSLHKFNAIAYECTSTRVLEN